MWVSVLFVLLVVWVLRFRVVLGLIVVFLSFLGLFCFDVIVRVVGLLVVCWWVAVWWYCLW